MDQSVATRALQIERALVAAEREINLIGELSPLNFDAEVERLASSLRKGTASLPHFRYGAESTRKKKAESVATTISAVRIALADVGCRKALFPGLPEVFEGRIEELALEVEMLRACGSPHMVELSQKRFRFDETELSAAAQVAGSWSSEPLEECGDEETLLLSSAFEARRRAFGEELNEVVILERPLSSVCAIGESRLFVRTGARVSEREVERLWAHEVEGHLLPRLRAREKPAPCSLGSCGSSVDEEGRAVLLEERAGRLDRRRKRELALRFHLSLALRRGGPEALCTEAEARIRQGEEGQLARAVCRILRGGGLAREVVYLPGYLRVKEALSKTPAADECFSQCRASVEALPFFARLLDA